MISKVTFDIAGASLRTKITFYKKRAQEIEEYLSKKPNEWGRFQNEFNSEVNSIFRDIMNFEKENITSGRENKVYKLKRIFIKRIKDSFDRGDYSKWSVRKPFGYAGDFKIIEDIYQNNPLTTGFDRLFDNYFMMSAISIAVRNRKDDFKRFIINFIKEKQDYQLNIMSLASGPCREIKEILMLDDVDCENVTFDCYDSDERSLNFAASVLKGHSNINFIKENAIRIAFRKDIGSLIAKKYDLIYSTGLFDYLEERIATKLITNLKKLLNPGGVLIISDVRDRYSNPSLHCMEWVSEWELVYRNEEEFRNIFLDAGFQKDKIKPFYEQQGILQYILATNE